MAHLVDQALALERIEFNRARQLRHLDARARNGVSPVQIGTLLCLGDALQLGRLLQRQIVEAGDLVQNLEGLPRLIFDLLFGQLLIIKLHNFLDRARAVAQILGDSDQFLDDDRRARDGLQNKELPSLDALGNGHFAFAR